MGRKIPGKKHRGVKDPFKQLAKRQAELETKINAPPKDADDQVIPKSLERVVKLKEAVKSGKITKIKKRKKKKKNVLISVGEQNFKPLHPKAKPDKVVPLFQQKPGETEERFLHRVERDTHAFLKETQFEKKYGVLVNRNQKTGNIEGVTKLGKDELDNIGILKARDKESKKAKKKKKVVDKPKMTKGQKRNEKLKLKKEKQKEKELEEFKNLKDEIKFGEVVHEPPQIKIGPKRVDSINNVKPGKKDLLLHSVLNNSKSSKINSKKVVSMDRSGKRKKLPIGERRQLEKQQSDIIAAYRKLKMQKSTGFNN